MTEVRALGKTYRFPDGTPKDEMKAAIDRDFAKMQAAAPPIPEPSMGGTVPPPRQPPIPRSHMEGVGGMAGGLLGAPGGPAGMLGAGALGAAGGSALYDVLDATSRNLFRGRNLPPPEQDILGPAKRAFTAGTRDAAFSAGAMAAGPVIRATVKPALGKIFGIFNPKVKEMVDQARRFNVNLGTVHTSPRKWVRGVPRVMGVFPFVGTPFRTGQARVVGELDDAAADILNTLAPTSTMMESGKAMTRAAANRFKFNARVGSALYEKFYRLASRLPEEVANIVPSQPIKEAVGKIDEKVAREAIELGTGETLKKPGADAVGEFVSQLRDLPEKMTVEQARGLERTLNEIVSEGTKQGWDVSRLAGVKKALEKAKNNMDLSQVPEEAANAIRSQWKKANSFWHEMLKPFESATGQKFGRADRNIFNRAVWKPGSKEADEIYRDVFSTKSPDALKNLRQIVGPNEFKRGVRVHLGDALNKSRVVAKEGALVEDLFSAAKLERQLGLDTPEGREMLAEMLRGTPMSVKTLENFINVAKSATDIVVRDPSTFLTRRIVLMGGGGLMGGVAVGGGKMSIPASILITLGLRKGASFLMNPAQVVRMTRIMDDSTPESLRRQLLVRFFKSLSPDEEPQ